MGLSGAQANAKIKINADIQGAETTLSRLVTLLGVVKRTTDAQQLDKVGRDLHFLNSSLNQFAIASGIGFAAFTAGGIKAADTMKVFKAQFTGLTGSQAKANEMMQQMIDLSNKLKTPLSTTMQNASVIASALKLNGQDLGRLQEAYGIAQRLAIKQPGPGGGIEGAAYAISEAYAGQYRSLANRFNINQDIFRKALKETGDPLLALNKILNDLGITEGVAIEANKTFANSWQRLSESVGLLASTVLVPFIDNVLVPLVDGFVKLATELQKNYPHLTAFAAGFVAIALAVTPAAAALSNFIKLYAELRKFELANNLSQGLFAGLLNPNNIKAWGGGIGGAIGRTEQRFAPYQIVEGAAGPLMQRAPLPSAVAQGGTAPAGLGLLASVLGGGYLGLQLSKAISPALAKQTDDQLLGQLLNFLRQLAALLPQQEKVFINALTLAAAAVLKFVQQIGVSVEFIGTMLKSIPGFSETGTAVIGAGKGIQEGAAGGAKNLVAAQQAANKFLDDLTLGIAGLQRPAEGATDAVNGLSQSMKQLDEDALKIYADYLKESKDEQTKYTRDMAQIDLEGNLALTQEADDYQNKREAAQRDYELGEIQAKQDYDARRAQVQAESDDANTKATQDYQSRVTEITKTWHDDEAKRLAAFNTRMKRMQEDHQHNMVESAARLDAIGVINEIYNYNRDRQRAQEDFDKESAQNVEQLNIKLAQEKTHLAEIIQANKAAGEKKLRDLAIQYNNERLQAKTAFDKKMRDLYVQHLQDMARIWKEWQDKRDALAIQHARDMQDIQAKAQEAVRTWYGIMYNGMSLTNAAFKQWWSGILATISGGYVNPASTGKTSVPHQQYALGGDVPRTGMALVHKGEHVIDSLTANMLRRQGALTPAGIRAGGSTGPIMFNFSGVKDFASFEDNMPKLRQMVINVFKEALA